MSENLSLDIDDIGTKDFIFDTYTPNYDEQHITGPSEIKSNASNMLKSAIFNSQRLKQPTTPEDDTMNIVENSFGIYTSNVDSPFTPVTTLKSPNKLLAHVTFNISIIGNPKLVLPLISSFVGNELTGDETLIDFVMIQRGKRFKVILYLLPLYASQETFRKVVTNSHCIYLVGYDTQNSLNEIKSSHESITQIAPYSINSTLKYYIIIQDRLLRDNDIIAVASKWAEDNNMGFSSMIHDSISDMLLLMQKSIGALHQRRLNKLIKTFGMYV